MKETITTVKDERIANYSKALSNALEFEKDIKRHIQKGENMVYLTTYEGTASRSSHLEIGHDLLQIAQGAASGAHSELVYDRLFVKETGKEIRVINEVGKRIADDIIENIRKKKEEKSEGEKT